MGRYQERLGLTSPGRTVGSPAAGLTYERAVALASCMTR